MWIAIWGVFTLFIVVFVGWTLAVLIQQKRTWSGFAKKNKLKYEAPSLMSSPIVSGQYQGYMLTLYTGVQQTDDIRGQRFVTVIELQFGKGMPTGAAIATREFSGFISGLIFDKDYKPALAEWQEEYIARTRDLKNLDAYFTKQRQQVLCKLFGMRNSAALFFFDELEAVLRVESSDPLREINHLEKIIKQIKSAADTLKPTAAEKKEYRKLLAEEKKRLEEGDDDDIREDAPSEEEAKESAGADRDD